MENFSDDKGKDKEDLTNWIERGKMRIVEKIVVLKTLDEALLLPYLQNTRSKVI